LRFHVRRGGEKKNEDEAWHDGHRLSCGCLPRSRYDSRSGQHAGRVLREFLDSRRSISFHDFPEITHDSEKVATFIPDHEGGAS
jgi:hypothetical protein